MKNLIITLSFVFTATLCSAQNVKNRIQIKDLTPDMYKANVVVESKNLDKYEGNWIWEDGTKKFIIVFKKQVIKSPITNGPFIMQLLSGTYTYFIENKKIELEPKRYHFLGGTEYDNGPVIFSFPNKNTSTTYLELIYSDSNTLRLQLSAKIREGGLAAKDFPLPTNVTLKRIK